MIIFNNGFLRANEGSSTSKLLMFGVIFEKLKNIDMRAINYIDIGYLTNNITSDVIRVHIFIVTSIHIVATPLFLCFFLVILLIEIGVYCLAGIGILLLLLGITMVIGKFIAKATASKLKLSGVRNKETTFMLT